ncbi:MAG: hypothetical protein ACQESE_02180 [Nanobdellota archaeon]
MARRKNTQRQQLLMSLMTLNILFGLLFVFSAVNIAKDRTMLGIGLTPVAEHAIIAIVVVISLLNIIIELRHTR